MRLAIRADAQRAQGAGHLMRCMTLAEVARDRGHGVVFVSAVEKIEWLRRLLEASRFDIFDCAPDSLDLDSVLSLQPDWVIVDSYRIPATQVSALDREVPCLALIDGDHRDQSAHLYVDSNLDAEHREWPPEIRPRLLAGSDYAIVRNSVLAQRRSKPWEFVASPPRVVVFMGGTDPLDFLSATAQALLVAPIDAEFVFVASSTSRPHIDYLVVGRARVSVVDATEKLPELLGSADIVISAAGTSAWDICTLGLPSILIGLADNQTDGLEAAVRRGVALGLDVRRDSRAIEKSLLRSLDRLIADQDLRRELSERALAAFDGGGASRIIEALESAPRSTPGSVR